MTHNTNGNSKFPLKWNLSSFGLVTWVCWEWKSSSFQIYPPAKDFWNGCKDYKEKMDCRILHCSYICILNAKGGHPVHTVLFTCHKIWNIRQPLSEIDLQGTGSINALPSLLCVLFSWSSFLFPCEALGVNSQVLRLVSWWKRKQ